MIPSSPLPPSSPVRRVLMTVDTVGGVWRYAMDLAQALKTLGVETVFAGLGPQPSAAQAGEARAIGRLDWLDAPLDWMVDDPEALRAVPVLLAALAGNAAVDLLHLNLPSQAAGLVTDLPVVAVSHSCVVTWFAGVRGSGVPDAWAWQKHINLEGLRRADVVVAPSRSHAAMIEAAYGHLGHLRVVHNASSLPPVSCEKTLPEKTKTVFAAGRWWDEGKNGAMLDAAAPDMRWPLVMAGPARGPGGQAISLSEADHRGSLSHVETMALMTGAGIFVSPSLYEPFGLAALEAARSEAALVLSDIPTYRELWDGAALFADPRQPAAFADAVNRLADDDGFRRDMAGLAQEKAAPFTPAVQATVMLGLYGGIVAPGRASDLAAAE